MQGCANPVLVCNGFTDAVTQRSSYPKMKFWFGRRRRSAIIHLNPVSADAYYALRFDPAATPEKKVDAAKRPEAR